jgi:hypothetical protein
VISLARNYDRKMGFRFRGHLHPLIPPARWSFKALARKPGLFF